MIDQRRRQAQQSFPETARGRTRGSSSADQKPGVARNHSAGGPLHQREPGRGLVETESERRVLGEAGLELWPAVRHGPAPALESCVGHGGTD